MDSSTDTSLAMGACPPLEDIAAFLDGALSKEERERIVAHLADCETCYDVFAGAADFQLTSAQTAEPKGKVVRFPFGHKKTPPWWLTAAAAAVLAVLVGFPVYRLVVPPEVTVAELTVPAAAKTDVSKYLYPAATYRDANAEAGDPLSDSHSFLAGVFLVDLRLTIEARDRLGASDRLFWISKQVRSLIRSEDLAERYSQKSSTLKEAPPAEAEALLRQFGSELPLWEKELEERTFSDSFDFGKWAEAGRIAAKAQSPAFFERRENRWFLTWLRWRQKDVLDPEVLSALQEVRRVWKNSGLQPADFASAEKLLSRIIEHYERESEQILQDYEP